jgi:hypothetical protein
VSEFCLSKEESKNWRHGLRSLGVQWLQKL